MCKLLVATSIACLSIVLVSSASAGTITGVSSVSGSGLGFVTVPVISTPDPANDNQTGGGTTDNNIKVTTKRFDSMGVIDIEFTVTNDTGTTEYFVFETVDNDTGTDWSGYRMELGIGTGAGFSHFAAGVGLDFDAPFYDLPPSSTAFSTATPVTKDILHFSGGSHGSGAELYKFRIDVPDDISIFTLRQIPVPEPMSFSLLGIGMIGLVGFGRRRHRRIA